MADNDDDQDAARARAQYGAMLEVVADLAWIAQRTHPLEYSVLIGTTRSRLDALRGTGAQADSTGVRMLQYKLNILQGARSEAPPGQVTH